MQWPLMFPPVHSTAAQPPSSLSFADVVPTPPDGTPTIAAVTGRAVTLTWKEPKRLDSAIGKWDQWGVQMEQLWQIPRVPSKEIWSLAQQLQN